MAAALNVSAAHNKNFLLVVEIMLGQLADRGRFCPRR